MYRCELDILNARWRVTWNYFYGPFKEIVENFIETLCLKKKQYFVLTSPVLYVLCTAHVQKVEGQKVELQKVERSKGRIFLLLRRKKMF